MTGAGRARRGEEEEESNSKAQDDLKCYTVALGMQHTSQMLPSRAEGASSQEPKKLLVLSGPASRGTMAKPITVVPNMNAHDGNSLSGFRSLALFK